MEAVLHGGGDENLGMHILRAFQRRLCGNAQISEQLRKELKKLEGSSIKLTSPTAEALSVGAAASVTLLIGSVLTGPFAVVVAPLAGGISLLVIQSGIDGFCGWAQRATTAAAPSSSPPAAG